MRERERESFPTPRARDYRSPRGQGSANRDSLDLNVDIYLRERRVADLTTDVAADAQTEGRDERAAQILTGQLNPDWVEWLMGWPVGWSDLGPLPQERFTEWEAGGWWERDPSDDGSVPRITTRKERRVPRLKAIGNGQVPACAVMAWEILLERLEGGKQ